ncbi:MAG: ABC transporter permease [Thermomicrobiales bacterium]|nr:ABC transporter permease [Thermomicrobiales bacterium]
MGRYAIRRLLAMIPTLLAIYTITFFLMRATPGGPWDTNERGLPRQTLDALNAKYGLDKPLYQQYWDYLVGVVTRFDFGPSYKMTNRTVTDIVSDFLPVSIQLGLIAMTIALSVGLTLGIISALNQNKLADYIAMFIAIVGVSIPTFVIGPILVLIFAVQFRLLPTGGWSRPEHMILPAIVLALEPTALIARYTRSSMLEVIRQDYIRTARSKGLREIVIIVRHALRNALIPVITVGGVLLAVVVTGSFFVETIFGVPGIGRYFVSSIANRDYPVIMGTTLMLATIVTFMNLVVDLTYGFLDPRIRYD